MRLKNLFGIILMMGILLVSCGHSHKENTEQEEMQPVPTTEYQTPYNNSETFPVSNTSTEEKTDSPKAKTIQPLPPPSPKTTISRYYEEGYDKGYDDGEDDAVMDNGYGGQYDDECRYKGKNKSDYEAGYEDGYEAGYYDNNDLDE